MIINIMKKVVSIAILAVFLGALFTSLFHPFLIIRKWKLIPVHLNSLRTKAYAFSRRPLQELFSNGILHPKLF